MKNRFERIVTLCSSGTYTIVIPKKIVDKLEIKKGDIMSWEITDDKKITIRHIPTNKKQLESNGRSKVANQILEMVQELEEEKNTPNPSPSPKKESSSSEISPLEKLRIK